MTLDDKDRLIIDELVKDSDKDFTSRTDVIKYAVRLLHREKKVNSNGMDL